MKQIDPLDSSQGVDSIFSPEETADMVQALDSFRTGAGYEAGKWKVSDANRRPDVLGMSPPKSVKIRDLTLRVSDQMCDVALNHEQRLELLRAVVATGVYAIQLPSFARSHTMSDRAEEVAAAKSINPNVEVQAGARTIEDMDRAVEIGYDNVSFTTGAYLGSALKAYAGAVYHRAWQGRGWDDLNFPKSAKEVSERAKRLIDAGVARGLKVKASILLLSYADDDYVSEYARMVADAGATEIEMGDHASGMSPEAYAHYTRLVHEAAPNIEVAVHSHGLFGLATACCVSAGLAGAEILEASVNGFHDGPMQGDLAEVVAAMEILYGVSTGVDMSQLTSLSRLAERLMKQYRPGDWPITGTNVFDYGNDGDEYAQEFKVDRLIHMSVVPSVVGNAAHRRIGMSSGPWTMWDKLAELGIGAEHDEVEPILAACKEQMMALSRGLDDIEIRSIAEHQLKELRLEQG